jgi:hypothetical protein
MQRTGGSDAGLPPVIAAALLLIDQPHCMTVIMPLPPAASCAICDSHSIACLIPFADNRSKLHAQESQPFTKHILLPHKKYAQFTKYMHWETF